MRPCAVGAYALLSLATRDSGSVGQFGGVQESMVSRESMVRRCGLRKVAVQERITFSPSFTLGIIRGRTDWAYRMEENNYYKREERHVGAACVTLSQNPYRT